ncbi:MAG: TonB-dependent receptor plug domain-containing protein [Opitutaceae bacterium]|nr:TonB-dependent receptor plug domain-containing protein [Opitutaceae bacterium]
MRTRPIVCACALVVMLAEAGLAQVAPTGAPPAPPVTRAVAAAAGALGASSATTNSSNPSTAGSDEAIQLSPFEVAEDSGSGYATSSSMTVSRIATKITEIPVSALIINEKMIEDLVAVGIEETFNLISGLHHGNAGNGNQEANDFSLRGYTNSSAQRDGVDDSMFTSAGGFDYSFVERIEVVKGPNGILYGTHSPGGVVNIVSKRPRARPMTKISAMVGSWNFWRAEVDTSQFIDKSRRFSYRISGAVSNTDGPVGWPGDPKLGYRGINPSVLYRAKNGLEVWLWTAFVRDSSSRAKHVTPGFATSAPINNSTPGPTGIPLLDRHVIADGAGQNLIHAYSNVFTDTYELGTSKTLKFGPVTMDARLIGRYRKQLSDQSRVRATNDNQYLDASGVLLNTGQDNRFTDISRVQGRIESIYRQRVQYDERPVWRGDHTYSLDLNFTFNTWGVRHQTLLTASYTTGHNQNTNSTHIVQGVPLLSALGYPVVGNAARVFTYPSSLVHYDLGREEVMAKANTTTLRRTFTDNETLGIGFMERMSLWQNRVILIGGGRLTRVESTTATWNLNTGAVPTPTQQEKTSRKPGVSGLVKLHQTERGEIMAFVNLNQTYTPVFAIDRRLATYGEKFPDRTAQAREAGVKLDLKRSHVVMTASVFNNEETNFLRSLIDSDGSVTGIADQSYQAPIGTRRSRGVDFDLNFKLFGGLEAVVSYGAVDTTLDDGKHAEAVPYDTAGALVMYRWRTGWLKGFSAAYNYSHWGRSRLGPRTYWELDGGNRSNVILGYRWRRSDLRLRVENVLDVRDPQPGTFDQSIGITNPRNYRLGYTIVF